MESAAAPASKARAESVVKRRAVCHAEGAPSRANWAKASGSGGMLRIGPSTYATIRSIQSTSGPIRCR